MCLAHIFCILFLAHRGPGGGQERSDTVWQRVGDGVEAGAAAAETAALAADVDLPGHVTLACDDDTM